MRRNGFTLLEVLIALLVFSLGLLGMAGLLAVSVQTNHSAYLRTQATFLAQGMADRMRANNLGLWNNGASTSAYDGTYNSGTAGAASACLGAASCKWSDVVARDQTIFSNQLVSFLPSPSATIACKPTGTVPTSNILVERPPYSGQCTITIAWNEKSSETGHADSNASLTWVFQP
ncbi:MAG: type IV pilus modification protein PilV [Proteobacteria bacterium]|nr:type IV pilus modification protein PilV [Pseudomonadota bacterium]